MVSTFLGNELELSMVWFGVFGVIPWTRGTRFDYGGGGATKVIGGITCGDTSTTWNSCGAICGSFK